MAEQRAKAAQEAAEDHRLAEWARRSLETTKELAAKYTAPANDEDPTEVKWRFGITSNGYEVYKGPYVPWPDDPDVESTVDHISLHAIGCRDLAARLNTYESSLATMKALADRLAAPLRAMLDEPIEGDRRWAERALVAWEKQKGEQHG